jgi:Putative Actinobacterial Holin-X, holin superfamily III
MARMTAVNAPSGADSRSESIADLIKELRDDALLLVRQEVALAKTEMSEKIGAAFRNIGYAIAGGLVAFLGLVFILQAVTALIGVGLKAAGVASEQCLWLAPLIIGVVVAVIGTILVTKGIATLKNETLVPEKTIESLKGDKAWIQSKTT